MCIGQHCSPLKGLKLGSLWHSHNSRVFVFVCATAALHIELERYNVNKSTQRRTNNIKVYKCIETIWYQVLVEHPVLAFTLYFRLNWDYFICPHAYDHISLNFSTSPIFQPSPKPSEGDVGTDLVSCLRTIWAGWMVANIKGMCLAPNGSMWQGYLHCRNFWCCSKLVHSNFLLNKF